MNWKEFHKELDLRVAMMIEEQSRYPNFKLLTQTSVIEFLEFSHKKSKEEE